LEFGLGCCPCNAHAHFIHGNAEVRCYCFYFLTRSRRGCGLWSIFVLVTVFKKPGYQNQTAAQARSFQIQLACLGVRTNEKFLRRFQVAARRRKHKKPGTHTSDGFQNFHPEMPVSLAPLWRERSAEQRKGAFE
jgi:hypothetical protein